MHIANIFSGQYFFNNENNNPEKFLTQAEKYGFDKEAYMRAYRETPRWDKEKVENLMQFYTKLTKMLSEKGFDSLMLIEYATHKQRLASKRAEQLKQAERMAAIGQTAAMVGHDIRNPLTSMVGNVHYLKKHYPINTEDEKTRNNVFWNLDCLNKKLLLRRH
jgi:signal transduction histidine kinase